MFYSSMLLVNFMDSTVRILRYIITDVCVFLFLNAEICMHKVMEAYI